MSKAENNIPIWIYIFQIFDETKLPEQRDFNSLLKWEHISGEYHEYAMKVQNEFRIKYMGDYHDLCLKNDVLLLDMSLQTLEIFA